MVIKSARTGGELLLGAVEELQHVGDLLPEPGKGVVVVEVEFAELAETLAELHHRAAVVLNAGCWRQMQNNSSTDCSWHAYAVPESNNCIRPDLVEEVVEADGALEEAVEERPCGVLGAVPELLHHVVARVVLAAVEQRHRRVEPSSSCRRRWVLLLLVVGRRALAPRREEPAAAAEVGVARPAAASARCRWYMLEEGEGRGGGRRRGESVVAVAATMEEVVVDARPA